MTLLNENLFDSLDLQMKAFSLLPQLLGTYPFSGPQETHLRDFCFTSTPASWKKRLLDALFQDFVSNQVIFLTSVPLGNTKAVLAEFKLAVVQKLVSKKVSPVWSKENVKLYSFWSHLEGKIKNNDNG